MTKGKNQKNNWINKKCRARAITYSYLINDGTEDKNCLEAIQLDN